MITAKGFDWIRDRVTGSTTDDFTHIMYDRGMVIEDFSTFDHLSKNADATVFTTETANVTEGKYALKVGKSGTASVTSNIEQTATERPLQCYKHDKNIAFDMFIKDTTTLNCFDDDVIGLDLLYGQDTSNYRISTSMVEGELHVGWNYMNYNVTDDIQTSDTGNPCLNKIIWWRIRCRMDNASDTFTSGNVLMDNFRLEGDWLNNMDEPHQVIGITDAISEVVSDNTYSADATLAVGQGYDNLVTGHFLSRGIIIDAMDDATNWTINSTNTIADETTKFIEGGNSLKWAKVNTSTTSCHITQDPTASTHDVTDMYIGFWVYIKDATTYGLMSTPSSCIKSFVGQNISNFRRYDFLKSELGTGWNFIFKHVDDFDNETGSPDMTVIDFLRINILPNNATDTWSSGDIITDYWVAFDYPYIYNKIVPINKFKTYQIVSKFDVRVV